MSILRCLPCEDMELKEFVQTEGLAFETVLEVDAAMVKGAMWGTTPSPH